MVTIQANIRQTTVSFKVLKLMYPWKILKRKKVQLLSQLCYEFNIILFLLTD